MENNEVTVKPSRKGATSGEIVIKRKGKTESIKAVVFSKSAASKIEDSLKEIESKRIQQQAPNTYSDKINFRYALAAAGILLFLIIIFS